MTRRYVRTLAEGGLALPTSIEFLVGLDGLAVGVAAAVQDRKGFAGRLRTNPYDDLEYWDEADLVAARRAAAAIGRGMAMSALRSRLQAFGSSAIDDGEGRLVFRIFPEEIARDRAGALWPDLDPARGPFGPDTTGGLR